MPSVKLLSPEVLSAASALAAWVALALAFLSNRTSKQALRIAKRDAESKVPRIVPYLIDSVATRFSDARRVIDVAVSLSNPSDSTNTLARAELAITHVMRDHNVAQLLVPTAHTDNAAAGNYLQVPTRIDAHSTLSGRLTFPVPDQLVGTADIRRYALQLTDVQGAIVVLEIGIMRDVTNRTL